MNLSTLRLFFTSFFLLFGAMAFGASFSENWNSYASRNDTYKYGYVWQATVISTTNAIENKSARFGPLSNPSSPSILTTGWLYFSSTDTLGFTSKVTSTTSSATLTVAVIDVNGTVTSLGSSTYANTSNKRTRYTVGVNGWYRVRFTFAGNGGSAYGILDYLGANTSAVNLTTNTTKLADFSIVSGTTDKSTYKVGDNLTYTMQVVNNGPDVAESATVGLNIPSNLSVTSVTFNTVTGTYNSSTKTLSFDNINNAATGSVVVVAKVLTAGTFDLTATFNNMNFMTDRNSSNNVDYTSVVLENVVLPVEFAHFSATPAEEGVVLNWKTAMEKNAAQFNIMYSNDGINYELVGTVSANGNSNSLLAYAYTHNINVNGKAYYQIIEVDFDGATTKSPKVVVNTNAKPTISINTYPNPTTNFVTISFNVEQDASQLRLINASGVEQKLTLTQTVGNEFKADLTDLNAGAYYLLAVGSKPVKIIKN